MAKPKVVDKQRLCWIIAVGCVFVVLFVSSSFSFTITKPDFFKNYRRCNCDESSLYTKGAGKAMDTNRYRVEEKSSDKDEDALVRGFDEVVFDWDNVKPAGRSALGDNIFKGVGGDLREFYVAADGNFVCMKLVVEGNLSTELSYEFYIHSGGHLYQLRIIPFSRIYLWEHVNGQVEPYKNDKGLKVETRNNYVEVSFPKRMFQIRESIIVHPEIFNFKLFERTRNITISHDSEQFTHNFEVVLT
jgi:hypothetical protein